MIFPETQRQPSGSGSAAQWTVPKDLESLEVKGVLLTPEDSVTYYTFLLSEGGKVLHQLDESEINTIKTQIYYLRAVGYVKYLDIFEKERESRFCEYYVWPNERHRLNGFQPLLHIPQVYRKHT
jgi:hypothetical protein